MITLLLHGFSGDKSSWDEVIEHWQPHQPVLSLDLPGHGEAAAVEHGWEANLASLRRRIGPALADATVVGYSLGARVALGLLAGGHAARAILLGVNPGIGAEERVERRRGDAVWIQLLEREGVEAFAARWREQPLFATQRRASAEARHRRHLVRCSQSAEGLARSLREMGLAEMPDYRERLPTLAARVHLVVGDEDVKFRAIAERAVAAAPQLPLHLVAGGGHDLLLERPQALAALLSELVAPASARRS